MSQVRSAAVLGAGTMGAQIAAHFANAGVPVLLLDLTGDAAREGLKRAHALKPDPFFTRDTAALVRTGLRARSSGGSRGLFSRRDQLPQIGDRHSRQSVR